MFESLNKNSKTNVLVLGVSGMLGNAMLKLFAQSDSYSVVGSARSNSVLHYLPRELHKHVICGVDVENADSLMRLFSLARPNVVINCIGLVKQLAEADDPLAAIPINALLPHRLVRLCDVAGARLIHMSTDCVFAGTKGMYSEQDYPDAMDLYGRSKYLGEVNYRNAVTLRTSIIGHELNSSHGLIDWFLTQQEKCRGYRSAVFSGVPTVVLAKIIRDVVIPHPELHGVYHVAAKPIAKYDLLTLVAKVYGKSIEIVPDDQLKIDRSLNAERFQAATGYVAPEWAEMIELMYACK